MPRRSSVLSRMDILVLSSLARIPMHGYELKLELQYRHVHWWAKCEHSHLYATLARLEKKRLIRQEKRRSTEEGRGGGRRVYQVTAAGRRKLLQSLEEVGASEDGTYFDIDLFLAGAYLTEQAEVVRILAARAEALSGQLERASALKRRMGGAIPAVGSLIIDHRIEHLRREVRFAERAAEVVAAQEEWGSFLGTERIADFIERTGVAVEQL